jgi:hypothetical protein
MRADRLPSFIPPFDIRSAVKRFLLKILLLGGGLTAGLVVAEVALRVVGYSCPNFYTTDRHRGVALRSGMEGWYRRESRQYVRINSAGFRDREHARAKPADTLRIAVIGDSYAEAMQVALEESFWATVEQRLKPCPALAGRKVEVLSFGVSGYGTAQELITLRQYVWDYSPDIVLLLMTTNNDITDNSRPLKKQDIPYFIFRDGGLLALDDSFRDSRLFRFRDSAFIRFFDGVINRLRVIQAMREASYAIRIYWMSRGTPAVQPAPAHNAEAAQPADAQKSPVMEEVGIDNMIYREPDDQRWTDAWRVTEGLIALMREEVRSKGARFLVVTGSNAIQVHPSPASRQDFMRRLRIDDLFYPDRRVQSFCEREGIPVLNLAPSLQAYAEQHNIFLHGFGENIGNGHWNPSGHRLAGELIAQRLCEGIGGR